MPPSPKKDSRKAQDQPREAFSSGSSVPRQADDCPTPPEPCSRLEDDYACAASSTRSTAMYHRQELVRREEFLSQPADDCPTPPEPCSGPGGGYASVSSSIRSIAVEPSSSSGSFFQTAGHDPAAGSVSSSPQVIILPPRRPVVATDDAHQQQASVPGPAAKLSSAERRRLLRERSEALRVKQQAIAEAENKLREATEQIDELEGNLSAMRGSVQALQNGGESSDTSYVGLAVRDGVRRFAAAYGGFQEVAERAGLPNASPASQEGTESANASSAQSLLALLVRSPDDFLGRLTRAFVISMRDNSSRVSVTDKNAEADQRNPALGHGSQGLASSHSRKEAEANDANPILARIPVPSSEKNAWADSYNPILVRIPASGSEKNDRADAGNPRLGDLFSFPIPDSLSKNLEANRENPNYDHHSSQSQVLEDALLKELHEYQQENSELKENLAGHQELMDSYRRVADRYARERDEARERAEMLEEQNRFYTENMQTLVQNSGILKTEQLATDGESGGYERRLMGQGIVPPQDKVPELERETRQLPGHVSIRRGSEARGCDSGDNAELRALRQRNRELEEKVAELKYRLVLEDLAGEETPSGMESEELEERLQKAERRLKATQACLQRTQEDLKEAEKRCEKAERRQREAEEVSKNLSGCVSDLMKTNKELRNEVKEVTLCNRGAYKKIEQLESENAELKARVGYSLESEKAELKSENAALKAMLGSLENEKAELRKQLKDARRSLEPLMGASVTIRPRAGGTDGSGTSSDEDAAASNFSSFSTIFRR